MVVVSSTLGRRVGILCLAFSGLAVAALGMARTPYAQLLPSGERNGPVEADVKRWLEKRAIPFRVDADGNLAVPREGKGVLAIELLADGAAPANPDIVGWLFERDAFRPGPEYKVREWLERCILQLDEVQEAKVRMYGAAMGASDQGPSVDATVSVSVKLKPGRVLTPLHALGIERLAAGVTRETSPVELEVVDAWGAVHRLPSDLRRSAGDRP